MLKDMMQKLKDMFKPYTFEDYVYDNKPQTQEELEALERQWILVHSPNANWRKSYYV